jgi:hypothetical protein
MTDTYEGIPNYELWSSPARPNFLLQEKPALCNMIIHDCLTNEPIPTVAPIRRTQPG